ncbi:MAG: hypothetical protein R3F42_12435 [Pseudomonadota bacterium]
MMRQNAPAAPPPRAGALPGLAVTLLALLPLLCACDSFTAIPQPAPTGNAARDDAYRVLHTLLRDERYIKALRIIKDTITFQASTAATASLIDDIATLSSRSLDQIDKLAALDPAIDLGAATADRFGSKILDALRVATARDLITASREDFEVNLVVSQTQALRVISQLLEELQALDTNHRRQTWLADLAAKYEALYRRAVARLAVAGKS